MSSGASLLTGLDPTVRSYAQYALAIADYFGVPVTVTSGYRSIADQQKLYDNRASNPYPVNRPGDSSHNFGLGWDSSTPSQYMPAWIAIREYLGFRVADEQGDPVHAEVPNWRSYVSK